MIIATDVDIDFQDRDLVLSTLHHVKARSEDQNKPHNSGVYFQQIPRNPHTNVSTIGYKTAENMGYFKVDFLNNHVYEDVKSEEHLEQLLNREPMWQMLENREIVETLFHISNYANLTTIMKPKSVEELAMLLAIIRPSKSHLKYKPWDKIKKEVWKKTKEDYVFRKCHAIAYALAIVVQMNLLAEQAVNTKTS